MTRLRINIKEADKAMIVLNLLKELPFVEIEKSDDEKPAEYIGKGKGNLEDLFGLWENRDVSIGDIRKKAWDRHHDTL
jgi:hypothetical protein